MGRSARQRRREREQALRLGTAPLSVLLVGRTHKRTSGGIARSAKLIADALESVGDSCRLRSVTEPLTDIPSDTDVIYHYGDYDHIEQHVGAAAEAGVPIVINSSYDGLADRRRWLIDQMASWAEQGAYLAVFSRAAAGDPRMRKIASRLVTIPKTIRVNAGAEPRPFGEREGICIGEIEKLNRPRLWRGTDRDALIEAVRHAAPEATLYAYNQYGGDAPTPIAGVEVVSERKHADFMSWLGNRRLFVVIARNETFAMPPAEAQQVGTVCVCPSMPQSLDEHLGMTGPLYAYDDPGDLAGVVRTLYNHERVWSQLSRASVLNGRARSAAHVGGALSIALRRVAARGGS